VKSAFDSLAPGGWLETQDICLPARCDDDSMKGTVLWEWNENMMKAAEKLGRPWTNAQKYAQWMEELGFEDVHEVVYQWPNSPWPKGRRMKELSMWVQQDFLDGLQGLSMALFTRGLGWSSQQVEVFLIDVRKDIKDRKIHNYWPIYFVYGRKPNAKAEA